MLESRLTQTSRKSRPQRNGFRPGRAVSSAGSPPGRAPLLSSPAGINLHLGL